MPPKRKQRPDEADEPEEEHDRKRFAILKPRTRHIAERTIKAKWTTLPESVQEKVKGLFRSIERPVITRHRDERKRIEAQTAVVAVRRKYVQYNFVSTIELFFDFSQEYDWSRIIIVPC